jgi:uncharacterized membrane protein
MSLESNKTLGGVGALLTAIGFVVPIIGIVGFIILLIALNGIANTYNERGIFQNALYGTIFGIIGIAATAIVTLGLFFGMGLMMATPDWANPLAWLGAIAVILVVVLVFMILTAIFFKKSFDLLGDKTGEGMFHTAGLLILLGAVLTIVIIGLILLLVAFILVAVAFFSMKTTPTAPSPPQPPQ